MINCVSKLLPVICTLITKNQALQMISNQKYPRCKKGRLRTKTGLAEKDVKLNGRQRPPYFNRFESFSHDELTAKHCYFRCSRPPYVNGIKSFDKDDQAAKH